MLQGMTNTTTVTIDRHNLADFLGWLTSQAGEECFDNVLITSADYKAEAVDDLLAAYRAHRIDEGH